MQKLVALLDARGATPDVAARHVVLAAEPSDAVLVEPAGGRPRPVRHGGAVLVWPRDDAQRREAEEALAPHASRVLAVDEVVHWDELDADADPLVLVYTVRRRPDLSFDAFAAHYRERHAPLARIHHPGIVRYVQGFCDPRDEASPDAVSELWFASERDACERFYRDDTSRALIAEDVRRFLDLRAGTAFAARPVARAAPTRHSG